MSFPRIFVKLWFRQTCLDIKYSPPVFDISWKNIQLIPFPPNPRLRKNYLASCYEDKINKIRNNVRKNKIWVCIDETSDVDGRFVANVVVGTLKHEQPGEILLLACEV
jgi:hypothetical protein